MVRHRDPETGEALRQARTSLIGLLVGTVLLNIALEVLVNLLWAPAFASPAWWAWLIGIPLAVIALAYGMIAWDDRRIGERETRIELLLPYVLSAGGRRVEIGLRRSYGVTGEAREAWQAYAGAGRSLRRPGVDGLPAQQALLPEHMALVRHLLALYVARFGRQSEPRRRVHGFLRIDLPLAGTPWADLPPLVRENPFSKASSKARPSEMVLPDRTEVEAYDRGEVLFRLRWCPAGRGWSRLTCALLGLGRRRPGGEIEVRWLGPLSTVRPRDRPYDHLTARLGALGSNREVCVIRTHLVIEVRSRWNALDQVSRFRDWGINLAAHLCEELDYEQWREEHVRLITEDLDWKIGWMDKRGEPGLAERLRRIDERLARLEAHLWPDEPAQGEGEDAWLSTEEGE